MTKAKEKFDLIELDGEECWCIKIKSGAYEDVVYKYNSVSVDEPESGNDYATLRFSYEILYHAELPDEKFDEKFEILIGDFLYDIIDEFNEPEQDTQ